MTSRAALITLAGATFVYVTAETLPIGLVPQLSAGLDAGLLSALCVVGTALAAAGLLVTLAARRAFPGNGTSTARPPPTGR